MRRLLPLGFVALVATLFWLGRGVRAAADFELSAAGVRDWADGLGWQAPLLYVGALVFRQFLFLPAAALLPLGGVCFGATLGTVLGASGLVLSAAMKFGLARALGRDWVQRRAGHRLRRFEARVQRLGPALIGVATAHPVGPLSPLHWGAGLSSMAAGAFLIAVALGAPVRAFAYAFLGSTLGTPGSPRFVVASALLLAAVTLPLAHPRLRHRLFARARPSSSELRHGENPAAALAPPAEPGDLAP